MKQPKHHQPEKKLTHKETRETELKKRKRHWGFSLIELVTVAGIISLIATFATISISKARIQARDVKRVADTKSLTLALESYFSKNNAYPAAITPGQPLVDNDGIVYMSQVPGNPKPHTDGNCLDRDFHYETINNGSDYMLTFCLGAETGSFSRGVNFYGGGGVPKSCGVTITDRDGFTYNTVNIGGQCWLAENLKTRTKPDGTLLTELTDGSERDCMSSTWDDRGDETDCQNGRALYSLSAALDGSTIEGAQGLCPDGWHIPSDSEWHTLEAFLAGGSGPACDPNRSGSGCSGAGTKMMTGGSSGFNNNFTGMRLAGGHGPDTFIGWNSLTIYWSSTLDQPDTAYGRYMGDWNTAVVDRGIWGSSLENISVRCVAN